MATVFVPAQRQAGAIDHLEGLLEPEDQNAGLDAPPAFAPQHAIVPGRPALWIAFLPHSHRDPREPVASFYSRWMSRWFGQKRFGTVVIVQMDRTSIADSDLLQLAAFPRLDFLRLAHTGITDRGLKHLEKCQRLKVLTLNHTQITDDGVPSLTRLPRLRSLSLQGTRVTDRSLPALSSMLELKELWLEGTEITEAGCRQLQTSLPACRIQPPAGWPRQ